jgi:hypothetical protein
LQYYTKCYLDADFISAGRFLIWILEGTPCRPPPNQSNQILVENENLFNDQSQSKEQKEERAEGVGEWFSSSTKAF